MQLSLIRSNNMLHTITTTASLRDAIRVLEETCAVQEKELRYEAHEALERLKPKNLARSAVTTITESPGVQQAFLPTMATLVTTYVSKRLFVGSTHNPFRKLTGSLLQLGIASLAAKYRKELDHGLRNFLLTLLEGRSRNRQHV
jgi:hypothetical protein